MIGRKREILLMALAGLMCSALTGGASADIQVFWKTFTCPNFNNAKPALASELGRMETGFIRDPGTGIQSIGGVYCVPRTFDGAQTNPIKEVVVANANIGEFQGGDTAWGCVYCQYPDKVIFLGAGMPAISLTGAGLATGVLLTFALIRLRKRQAGIVA